jgi:hypothetical protein
VIESAATVSLGTVPANTSSSSRRPFSSPLKPFAEESEVPASASSLSSFEFVSATEGSSLPRDVLDPIGWRRLADKWRLLLEIARDEVFEDGVQGPFARGLRRFLSISGIDAVAFLQQFAFGEGANVAIVAEILRYLGMEENPLTRDVRLQFLVRCLTHHSAAVRDASGIGLAYLRDKRALPDLRNAAQRERYPELRDDLLLVIKQLELQLSCR